ncbi:MAG: phosphopentomutase [Desulfuromonas sp.]|nr:MAG: phosphopentomutase [Desulfuromonas sp.]
MAPERFSRVILIVLDGVGVGALPDAACFGDADANTLRHVAEAVNGLDVPHLKQLGLGNICPTPGLEPVPRPEAAWGKMAEISCGKDTTTGHWELAGLPTVEPFATFPLGFPPEIMEPFEKMVGKPVLGNIAASGTDILRELGEEHLRTGRLIVYTSVDSVFQIAAHEDVVPPGELYAICRSARDLLDPFRVGRVIARPFTGTSAVNFKRTHRRHDFSMPPPAPTLLDHLVETGIPVKGIGKISDIFAGCGIAATLPTRDNRDGMAQIIDLLSESGRALVFANLVDFDMLYGHRLDAAGFADALAEFNRWLPELKAAMNDDDLLLLTADHGCDPTTSGTDHSREYVPLLAWHRNLQEGISLGVRNSFCDVAATIAEAFGTGWPVGKSVIRQL